MNSILLDKLKKNGFVFLSFNKNIKNYVYKINKIIDTFSKKIYSNKLKKENFAKLIFQIQKEINTNFSTEYFFKKNNQLFKKIFKDTSFQFNIIFI